MKNELSKLNDPLVGLPMLTPFNENDEVDYDFAQYNIEKWNKTDADIIIVGTASGEESYLNESEKLKLLSVVSDSVGEGKVSCAGIDSPSIKETLRLETGAKECIV